MCNLGNKPTKRRDVMNEEIEEMMLTVPQKIVAYDGKHPVQHLYREQRQEIAEAIYNAGYRKVGSDAKGNMLKIQNLCIEFDEMGYEPTTLCENPEQTAKKWKTDLMYEIGLFLDEAMGIKARYNELKAENERLKEKCEELRKEKLDAQDDQRKQAVKEFAEKLIRLVFDYLDVENAEQAEKLSLIDSTLTYDVILHAIDKLIEEEN